MNISRYGGYKIIVPSLSSTNKFLTIAVENMQKAEIKILLPFSVLSKNI